MSLRKKQTIFSQGDSCDAVFYVQTGKVKLTVTSKSGKEAIIGIWNEGSFFGEGCLVGQAKRIGTASAMTDCKLTRIENDSMKKALRRGQKLSDMFLVGLTVVEVFRW